MRLIAIFNDWFNVFYVGNNMYLEEVYCASLNCGINALNRFKHYGNLLISTNQKMYFVAWSLYAKTYLLIGTYIIFYKFIQKKIRNTKWYFLTWDNYSLFNVSIRLIHQKSLTSLNSFRILHKLSKFAPLELPKTRSKAISNHLKNILWRTTLLRQKPIYY